MRRASPSAAASNSSRAPGVDRQAQLRPGRARVASARSSKLPEILRGQRLEHVHPRPRQQRVVHFERRVLGGRADENQRAVLDIGQEGVLLRLVEAMHLVEKQHRVARAAQAARLLHHGADVLDAREHRRQRDELRVRAVRHQARQRRLAGARRTPQNHRMRPPGLERAAQRRAGSQQVRLPTYSSSDCGRSRSASGR
jgi:hypothetical protein